MAMSALIQEAVEKHLAALKQDPALSYLDFTHVFNAFANHLEPGRFFNSII